ncbi:MAG: EF-hand domain-containing protein, partial [Pirellulales bacterium]
MNHEKAEVRQARVGALFCGALVCAALLSVCGLSAAAEQTPSDAAEAREPTDEFRGRDADGDERLSLEELLSGQPETEHASLRQRFVTLDFDGSGDLDREEFRKISSPPRERGNIPDPIADLERATAEKWREAFAEADGDGDGALSSKQWPAERMALAAPELADLTFQAWDRDRSGTVTVEEGAGLLEVAYGLRRPDGRPLRTENGRVLSWNYVRMLDTDRDGVLSRDEFVPKYFLGEAKNAERFSELDADQDGRLD